MRELIKCPLHKIDMLFIEDVENKYHKGVISHSKYKCSKCAYFWNYNGNEMWSDAPPRQVILKKIPEIGDNIDDIIKPTNNDYLKN